MQPSPELKNEILELEASRRQVLEKQKAHTRKQEGYGQEAETMREKMGWREKFMPRWVANLIGGNTELMDRYADKIKARDEQANKGRQYGDKAGSINSNIITAISDFLRANDPAYETIIIPLEAAEIFRTKINSFQNLIQNALSEIDDAQSMETMDLLTKNKGISMMSTFANGNARRAVDMVKLAAPDFKKAAQDYQETYKDLSLSKIESEFGDTMDFVLDMAFGDGFDFMSVFNLSALGCAEDNMEEFQKEVNDIKNAVNKDISQLKSLQETCIVKTRKTCLSVT